MFRSVRPIVTAAVLLAGLPSMTVLARPAAAADVPAILEPPDGFSPFLKARAAGTQNYVCVATPSAVAWKFVGPQATLFVTFAGFEQQVTTHFLSPNPEEPGVLRPVWQQSIDTSRVWGRVLQTVDDADVVAPGAIPWLLLERAGAAAGPAGGGYLAQTRYIQRINTAGGKAPSTGCSQPGEAGAVAFVPYTTDYVFFRASRRH